MKFRGNKPPGLLKHWEYLFIHLEKKDCAEFIFGNTRYHTVFILGIKKKYTSKLVRIVLFFQKGGMKQLLGPRISKIFFEPNSMESVLARVCLIILVIICGSFIIYGYLRKYIEHRDKMLDGGIHWKKNMNLKEFLKWKKSRFRYKVSLYKEKIMRTELVCQVRGTLLYLDSREGEIMRWILAGLFTLFFVVLCLEKILYAFTYLLAYVLRFLIVRLIYVWNEFLYIFFSLLDRLGLLEKFLDLMYRMGFFR